MFMGSLWEIEDLWKYVCLNNTLVLYTQNLIHTIKCPGFDQIKKWCILKDLKQQIKSDINQREISKFNILLKSRIKKVYKI